MLLHTVGIYVWKGKAYLPTQAQFRSGIFVDTVPVHVVNLSSEELESAITAVVAAGHPLLPDPAPAEEKKHKDPVLQATCARSWYALAREGASYTISWTESQVRLDISRVDAKGRWQNDPRQVQVFPKDTPLQTVVSMILKDIQSRSLDQKHQSPGAQGAQNGAH